MEAKNFRIGNFITNHEVNEGFFKVEEVKKNEQGNYAVYYRRGSCMSIEPDIIEINEKWLCNLGFVKKSNDVYYLYACSFEFEWIVGEGIYIDGFSVDIEYVHELQNLFFAVTGEELELKQKQSA